MAFRAQRVDEVIWRASGGRVEGGMVVSGLIVLVPNHNDTRSQHQCCALHDVQLDGEIPVVATAVGLRPETERERGMKRRKRFEPFAVLTDMVGQLMENHLDHAH